MNLRPLPAVFLVALLSGPGCRRREEPAPSHPKTEPAKAESVPVTPPPAEGQVTMELELLRAPLPLVGRILLTETNDAAFREQLLAAGATSLVHCTAAGAAEESLEATKMKTIREPVLYEYSSLWYAQQSAKIDGEPIPSFDGEESAMDYETGYALRTSLEPADAGIFTTIEFRWLDTPLERPVNSWPVEGRTARVLQDRKWELNTQLMMPPGKSVLLAIAPEPPGAEGQPTGFALIAFGKAVAAATGLRSAREGAVATLQTWTLELPAAAAHEWLSRRRETSDDGTQLQKLLNAPAPAPNSGALLSGVEMVRRDAAYNDNCFVDSRLSWWEPAGFEPADTRYVKFIPVPNDYHGREVAQRLECGVTDAALTLPEDGVKWTRWHGSTRGARDEPTGVESSATGSSTCSFFAAREPGSIFLAHAYPCGPNTRLTFARSLRPASASTQLASAEYSLTIFETPPGPWLPRLVAGEDLAHISKELPSAPGSTIIHEEVSSVPPRDEWKREATWPCLSYNDYLNPSIHDGKMCFNPRAVLGSSPACRMEMGMNGPLRFSIAERPVPRHFGLWLPKLPDYNAENSGIPLPEWPELTVDSNNALIPPGRDTILSVSLDRSRSAPDQRALHWIVVKRINFHGFEPFVFEPPARPEPVTSFTITAKNGTVQEHITFMASDGTASDGRQIQSLEPRIKVRGKDYFSEAPPENTGPDATRMSSQPMIIQALDGIYLECRKDEWALTYSLEPARKITETLTAKTEQPVGTNYGPQEDIPVSCERLVMRRETLTGTLPAPGKPLVQPLQGGRSLTVSVR